MIRDHRLFKPALALWVVFFMISFLFAPREPNVAFGTHITVGAICTAVVLGGWWVFSSSRRVAGKVLDKIGL